jgi:hypothetical protein
MPPRLSIAIGAAIDRDLVALRAEPTPPQISMLAVNYKCSSRSIYRHLERIQAGRPLLAQTGGQQRVITPQIDAVIYHLLNEYLWFYQDEIAEFLLEVYDIEVSQYTISIALA